MAISLCAQPPGFLDKETESKERTGRRGPQVNSDTEAAVNLTTNQALQVTLDSASRSLGAARIPRFPGYVQESGLDTYETGEGLWAATRHSRQKAR